MMDSAYFTLLILTILFLYYLLVVLRTLNPFTEPGLFAAGLASWLSMGILAAVFFHWGLFFMDGIHAFVPAVGIIMGLSLSTDALRYYKLTGRQKATAAAFASVILANSGIVIYFSDVILPASIGLLAAAGICSVYFHMGSHKTLELPEKIKQSVLFGLLLALAIYLLMHR